MLEWFIYLVECLSLPNNQQGSVFARISLALVNFTLFPLLPLLLNIDAIIHCGVVMINLIEQLEMLEFKCHLS
jgi:hypothetical protein